MSIRPLSAVSDLEDEFVQLLDEAFEAGLDADIIIDIINDVLRKWDNEK